MSIIEKRRVRPRRIRLSTRASLKATLVFALVLLVGVPALAQEKRGPSRVEVLGVDQFHTPALSLCHRKFKFQKIDEVPERFIHIHGRTGSQFRFKDLKP